MILLLKFKFFVIIHNFGLKAQEKLWTYIKALLIRKPRITNFESNQISNRSVIRESNLKYLQGIIFTSVFGNNYINI